MRADDGREPRRRGGERMVPADPLARVFTPLAQLRLQQARLHRNRVGGGEVQRAALGAQAPEVRRVLRVAAHAADLPGLRLDDHAAADAAVGTGRARFARPLVRGVHAGTGSCTSFLRAESYFE